MADPIWCLNPQNVAHLEYCKCYGDFDKCCDNEKNYPPVKTGDEVSLQALSTIEIIKRKIINANIIIVDEVTSVTQSQLDKLSNIMDNNTPIFSGDLMQVVMVKVDAQIVD